MHIKYLCQRSNTAYQGQYTKTVEKGADVRKQVIHWGQNNVPQALYDLYQVQFII